MAIVKKLNQQTVSRLLLEDDGPVDLPAASVADEALVVQFESYRPHLPELLEVLRAGTMAEPVPVMADESTFAIHGATRTFWVKIWHASPELTQIEKVQVLSCLPSTRGVRIVFDDQQI